MIKTIDDYLIQLKQEMSNCDIATQQDALNDTEEHLSTALSEAFDNNPELPKLELLEQIINEYGSPKETAESYIELADKLDSSTFMGSTSLKAERKTGNFFSIFSDGKAWGAVLYSLLSLATGIIFFTWAVTGIAVSASMMILIIGIPITVAFFLSFRGLSFIEGRIVEGLLGVRMPRRQRYYDSDMKWSQKIKQLLLSKESWFSVIYFIIMLPLGIIYFTLTVTLITVSLALMASPFIAVFVSIPVIDLGTVEWGVPPWFLPFVAVIGFFLLKGSLHLIKKIGAGHGRMAKSFLVTKDK
ncbi:MAG TPA: hypothetical protein DCO79_11910 [Spirochaeta sp.]|nr:hypothetical protein [Spirochaeta sp.]